MKRICILLAMLAGPALAQDAATEVDAPAAVAEAGNSAVAAGTDAAPAVAAADAAPGVRTMSGMSILGNEEAPKSLVIVPWKSSKLGDGLGVSNVLDESPRPVDREVFMRELHYYQLRSGGTE